jgi:hypothetical protein
LPDFNDDQRTALGLAIGIIETLTDAGYEPDEQDQNFNDLMDRYDRQHGPNSTPMMLGGLQSLTIILLKKVAEASGTTTDSVLQDIASEYGARGE